jgi:hypothetical protein
MNELLYSPKIKPEHLVRKAIVYLHPRAPPSDRQAGSARGSHGPSNAVVP